MNWDSSKAEADSTGVELNMSSEMFESVMTVKLREGSEVKEGSELEEGELKFANSIDRI